MNFTFVKNRMNTTNNSSNTQSWINKSGVYPFIIDYIRVQEYKTGSKGFSITGRLPNSDSQTIIYGSVFEKADGNISVIGYNALSEIQTVFGLQDLTLENKTVQTFDGGTMDIDVFKEIQNKKCYIKVVKEWSNYNNKIRSKLNYSTIFRYDDKATALEIFEKKDFGSKYKYFEDNPSKASAEKYSDGLTEKDINEFLESKKQPTTEEKAVVTDNGDLPF